MQDTPKTLIQIINSVQEGTPAKIQISKTRWDEFTKKLIKGDSLSPLLFITVMDRLLKNTKERTTNLHNTLEFRNFKTIRIDSVRSYNVLYMLRLNCLLG